MRIHKRIHCYFLFVLFSTAIFSQKDSLSLESHLKKIETHFKVKFNYESGLLKDKNCKHRFFNTKASLQNHLSAIRDTFGLNFTMITNSKIVINSFSKDQLLFLDYEEKTPIVNLLIKSTTSKKNWITDNNGSVYFKTKTPKTITVSHLNYKGQTIKIDLKKTIQNLEELFVYSFFTNGTYKNKDGNFYIKTKDINALAGLTSHDIIKNLENLPQVISNSESTSDLIVKGGTHDQNLFVWNDIKVYQNNHFFGLISAFNENLISTIRLYDNATPAKYGNSTSAVISLEHDNKLSKKEKASIGINFLSADAYVEVAYRILEFSNLFKVF